MPTNTKHQPVTWPELGDAERSALREILVHGAKSRAETARLLGLSRTSLTRVTRRLMNAGLVTEGEVELRGLTGRPSEMLHARLDAHLFFGVKLTGDTLFSVVTDMGARILASANEPLLDRSVDSILDQVSAVFSELREQYPRITAAGLCVAGEIGIVEGTQVVLDSPFLGWRDVPVSSMLDARWGIPVTVENDVRALTATQHWFGAGVGCDSLAVITVGAGIGFGFVHSDRVIAGHHGRAGRLDHLVVDSSGPICGLGHRGCASAFLTSGSIVNALGLPGVDYAEAVELARKGNPAAMRAFSDAGHALGVLIGTVANTFDPEKIVLTGDGLAVVELAEDRIGPAIAAVRVPTTAATPLDVQPFEFTEWARAGAVAGIRTALKFG